MVGPGTSVVVRDGAVVVGDEVTGPLDRLVGVDEAVVGAAPAGALFVVAAGVLLVSLCESAPPTPPPTAAAMTTKVTAAVLQNLFGFKPNICRCSGATCVEFSIVLVSLQISCELSV